ncbi:hypothetical protein ACHAWT_007616 [Skeletonema menzelii]
MNIITSTLVVIILAAAAIAEAKSNRQLGSKASSKGGKTSSYSMSTSGKGGKGSKGGKGNKGGKGSYSYSMSYPPQSCLDLTFARCVIYIVELSDVEYEWQSMIGGVLGTFGTEMNAINDLTGTRGYVLAPLAEQAIIYSNCWQDSSGGALVTNPVYFPIDAADCGDNRFF